MNLHEISNDILKNYTRDYEMVGTLVIGNNLRNTHFRFTKTNEYEAHSKSIDQGYDSVDSLFNGFIYILKTPELNRVNRKEYENGCDFKHEFVEFHVNYCFIPTKVYCLNKCINFLTGKDYKQDYLNFISNEKRRFIIMTKARF